MTLSEEKAKAFGEFIKKIREEKGLGVNQLAQYSDVSSAQISRIENGKRGIPKAETINKLAKGLKVDPNKLMEVAGYLEPDKRQKKNEEINIAFHEGNATKEELEYLEAQLEVYRRMKKRNEEK
jgi:HTH-type transcriptional regulator, competence development regulator